MLEEIRQQPAALERTLAREMRRVERLRALLSKDRPRLIVLAARGTSDNAALFGRYLLEIATGIPVSLAAPSIHTLYDAPVDYRGALVVAVSQSGESTDTNLVLSRAREKGARTLGITNERSSSLARIAEHTLFVRAGKEKSVAATKTYTGQVLVLYLLAYALGARIRMDDLRRIPELAAAGLTLESEMAALSERYRFMRNAVVVGRGYNYANAFEFALKMMETSYIVAERFSSADFLHGPVAMVEPAFPVFAFCPSGPTWPPVRDMLIKVRHLKAESVVFTDPSNKDALEGATRTVVFPRRIPELLTPIPYIIPAQMFAACLAAQKGLNPDRPRTLSKVTLTL
jgi:glucosamine--fructose-6-phosphate aminotransferase (isomerizing)